MITLASLGTIFGVAGTASAITCTITGAEVTTGTPNYHVLAQSQLAISPALIYTAPASPTQALVKTIHLANVTAIAVPGCALFVGGGAPANQISGTFTIPANGWATVDQDGWKVYDANGALLTSGSVGPSGPAGPAGVPGPAIYLSADEGDQGDAGPPGAQGPQGPAGAAGAAGASGPQGPAVYLVGDDGDQGDVGPPGIAGVQGASGAAGATGAQGPVGSAVYLEAEQGEEGERGPIGATGVQGPQGVAGSTGAQGPAGVAIYLEAEAGDDGERGPAGAAGVAGAAGATGSQGPAGVATFLEADQGDEGERGPPGPPGPTGPAGSGATGAQGPVGLAVFMSADDGEPGDFGPPGANGAPGVAGVAGVAGANGAQGMPGVDGEDADAFFFQIPFVSNGQLLNRHVLTAASGTYVPTAGTCAIIVRMVGAGAGGGGAVVAAGDFGPAGGGASGVYLENTIITPNTLIAGGAFTCGAAGAAGSTAGGTGGTGGDTTIVLNGVTFTAKGGLGGTGVTAATTSIVIPGGLPQTGSSAADVVSGGEPGGYGLGISTTTTPTGGGGNTPWGGGGPAIQTFGASAAGKPGLGFGSGGSGAFVLGATGVVGGAGAPGAIVIEEYPGPSGNLAGPAGAAGAQGPAGPVPFVFAEDGVDGDQGPPGLLGPPPGGNWFFLGIQKIGANAVTVGPVTWNGTFKQLWGRYLIKGYSGGTPVGRLLTGAATISTTAANNGNGLVEGGTATATSVSVPGCPLASTLSAIARSGYFFIDGASGDLKEIRIDGKEGNPAAASSPVVFQGASSFTDLSTNLPLQRAQLTVYDTLTTTTVSTNLFLTGSYLALWGRNEA